MEDHVGDLGVAHGVLPARGREVRNGSPHRHSALARVPVAGRAELQPAAPSRGGVAAFGGEGHDLLLLNRCLQEGVTCARRSAVAYGGLAPWIASEDQRREEESSPDARSCLEPSRCHVGECPGVRGQAAALEASLGLVPTPRSRKNVSIVMTTGLAMNTDE